MNRLLTFVFLFFTFCSFGQDGFFYWKITHGESWKPIEDSIWKVHPFLVPPLKDTKESEDWIQKQWAKKNQEIAITNRFLILSAALKQCISDSIQLLEQKKQFLLSDSAAERHRLSIQGIEKITLGLQDLPKQWWPSILEKELALMEWEKHEEARKIWIESSLPQRERDSIWMVQLYRNAEEALLLKNQLLTWYGIQVQSKQVYSLKISTSESSVKNQWNYFWGCDTLKPIFQDGLWKTIVSENQWKVVEKQIKSEEQYFHTLLKNRENWEFLDKRENTLDKMREFVHQYDQVYVVEDSIRKQKISRARSSQEMVELKRELERWKMDYYQKGLIQLLEIGGGMEGGPTVQDYSKQKGYFKLKDVQNVKKPMLKASLPEIIPDEKETIIRNKPSEMLQIPNWNGFPNAFKTLK